MLGGDTMGNSDGKKTKFPQTVLGIIVLGVIIAVIAAIINGEGRFANFHGFNLSNAYSGEIVH